jgi:TonB family protein
LNGVAVLMTESVGPAVSGVLRPRILAPEWLTSLPARERELILMHEEEHVRARDPMLVAVARAARILTPWNPVVWVLTARLVRAVELDCDRRVLERAADIAAYGHTLLKVSARRPGRLIAAAAFAESEAPLRNRILAMTTPSQTLSIAAIFAATVLGVVLLVGALGIPVPTINLNVQLGTMSDQRSASRPDQTPTVTQFDAPPTPPPPPPRPIVLRSDIPGQELVIIRSAEGEMVGYRLDEVSGASAPEPVAAEPRFTPMTVRPVLTNAGEVSRAMTREYPTLLRDAGIGGAPLLWLHIDETGAVDGMRIHESSGYEALDGAAMRVARTMRFIPAQNDEGITAAWVQLPIRFQAVN